MASPKRSPKRQNSRPIINRLWPFMPRKETCDRSGRVRFASPPPASGAACHMARFAISEVNITLCLRRDHWDLRTVVMGPSPLWCQAAAFLNYRNRASSPKTRKDLALAASERCPLELFPQLAYRKFQSQQTLFYNIQLMKRSNREWPASTQKKKSQCGTLGLKELIFNRD